MQKLLILGAGNLQIPLIQKAKSKGIYTIAVDMNVNAPGSNIANEFYPINTNNSSLLLDLAREKNVDGVITNSDYPMRTASFIATELNLVGMSTISATIATNKLLLREVLQENGILCPRFAKINKREDIAHYTSYIEFPFILKPVDSSASRGVNLIESSEQIDKAFLQSSQHSKNGYLIMEEYITGSEYSVESISINGITRIVAITAKMTSGAPHFVETGHIISALIDSERRLQMEELVSRAIRSIGITNGVSHTEIKVNPKGIFIIEIGPRLGGDYITTDLVPLATGFDIVGDSINIALGNPLDPVVEKRKFAGIGYFIAPEGELLEIKGIEQVKSSPLVHRYELFIKPGETVGSLKSSLDRAGYVIVTSDNYNDCARELSVLQESVHFVMSGR